MHRPVETPIYPPQHPFFIISYLLLFWQPMLALHHLCILTTRVALVCRTTAAGRQRWCVYLFVLKGVASGSADLCSACTRVICQHLSAFVITSQAFSLKVLDLIISPPPHSKSTVPVGPRGFQIWISAAYISPFLPDKYPRNFFVMSSLLIPYVKPHFTPQLIEIEAELNSFQAYISTPAELQNNVARTSADPYIVSIR